MASFSLCPDFFSAFAFLLKKAKKAPDMKSFKNSRRFIIISTFHFLSFLLVRNLSDSPLNPYVFSTPYPRDTCITELAFAIRYMILFHKISHSLNEHLLAFRTEGVFTFVKDISDIDELQTSIHGSLSRAFQCLNRGWRKVCQFIMGKKT